MTSKSAPKKKSGATEADLQVEAAQEQAYTVAKTWLEGSPSLLKLFELLWMNRDKDTTGKEIWKKVFKQPEASYFVNKRKESANAMLAQPDRRKPGVAPGAPGKYPNPPDNVSRNCHELGLKLTECFNATREGWVIGPPKGGPSHGYRLDLAQRDDPDSETRAFWLSHLRSPSEVFIVYVEQLFYQDWSNRSITRYYDCNEEHSKDALADLEDRRKISAAGLKPVYPYVAWGEIEARDLIKRWFARCENIEVSHRVTRHLEKDTAVWRNSLILFGSEESNLFIREALQVNRNLPIRFSAAPSGASGSQVTIADPTGEELRRFGAFKPVDMKTSCTLEFSPGDEQVLAILTRVPNYEAPGQVITIFNSEYGRAIHQLTLVLTEEERINKFYRALPDFHLPEFFQVLYSVPIRDLENNRATPVELLAWRPYFPGGV